MANHFTTSDGISLYYRCRKFRGSPHTLIFLHGLGGNLTAWSMERRFFHGRKISTYAIDLRGHGYSGRSEDPDSYKLPRIAQDINELVIAKKISHPILVGHCFGGIISIIAAAQKPSLYCSLVLIDTDFKPPWFATDLLDINLIRALEKPLSHLPDIHFPSHTNYQQWVGTSDWDWPRIFHDILHTSLKSYLRITHEVTGMDNSHLLHHLKMPILVISGQDDTIYPPKTAINLKNKLKQADFKLIKHGNHILVINQPKEISQAIIDFLSPLHKH
ncbi:hypothetical protein A2368_02710 [Candidatus Collierbacteria bacterium RIFOXYB1_FULL_49_13]|uniref:AB hydrolase-1 domain-containing protein n=1 Tax=Candidatus Collierbacteria bacterium RIFOXYB1_FULL_49_13 TaxID=1817728 RepID=A0A1F5FJ56_9BACT|nr:MAG: hypothetical protein A2368_02710 [Candidatus Collierbacteria bacterium RIFOXYB1_FULL_49_13]